MTHGKFRDPKHRIFIPYSLKRTNSNTFQTLLKENNQMLSDSYVMKIQGIPQAGIQQIKKTILDLAGVQFVVPTTKTQSHGEWRILIKASKFHGVNGYIRQHWESWCRDIPEECYAEVPTSFPIPAITSKNTRESGNADDASAETYGSLLSAASTLTLGTLDGSDILDHCPLDESRPTYAQVLHSTTQLQSPASTITQSVHRTTASSSNSNLEIPSGILNKWEEENRQLHQRIHDQEARLQALDKAKTELDGRLAKILEEVQNKECRAKELEVTIANLLTIVSDRDQQMAERDQQIDIRNRQFDSLMARLEIQQNTHPNATTTKEHLHRQTKESPNMIARSNKRHHTLQTYHHEDNIVTEYFDSEMQDTPNEASTTQK